MPSLSALTRHVTDPANRPRALAVTAAVALSALLVLLWVFDLRNALAIPGHEDWPGPPTGPMDFGPTVSGGICVLLLVAVVRPRTGPRATLAAAVAAPLVVTALSVLVWPLPRGMFGHPIAASEMAALLALMALTALRCNVPQIVVVSFLGFVAAYSDVLRDPFTLNPSNALLMVVVALAPGLYLRWHGNERRAREERARQTERLAIARDLHDIVAHEVTGIVVQAQALRHVAERDPEALREALPQIEQAGTRALESMRGLVSGLREQGPAPLSPVAVEDGLRGLAAPAAPGRPGVAVEVSGAVDALPPDVGTALLRVAQESVTNALRHARGAGRVNVRIEAAEGSVALETDDDGHGSPRRGGGGHGLVGMAERVRMLGGELSAGPAQEQQGWSVRASIPVPERERDEAR
ncbi:sensor histidine kinase [Nocardiopsis salina]|uniref:sensor histidine kinase n=1 Tax=Nocardiopsis salina TaxID=245836 RepID=UPI0003449D26|nr:histidine kinase [Nocardiopsis salina]